MITRLATQADIQGILDLQELNLFEKLSESEREAGFVTTPFTPLQLEELLEKRGLFVGSSEGEILGYTMAAGWDYFSQWAIFPCMIARLSGSVFKDTTLTDLNTFQYGPICIATQLRGTDAFPRLFEEMRLELASRYPVGITFINQVNARSIKAHKRKLGMVVVDEFEFSGRLYYGLAFDMSESVL